uniref:Activin types 1 and 2 receptor protein n=1 Tax=Musca domestica TaxID=7370 RepID=T1PFZ6_MUSDO
MVATTTTTTTNANKMMLYLTVIVAVITSQCLSAEAIRCHQCNSHQEEDCITLRLSTPGNVLNDQFLKECQVPNNMTAFCRKTVLKIEVTGEQRTVRECGWKRDKVQQETGVSCFSADHEGYTQIICACDEDGCNGSPSLGGSHTKWMVLAVTGVSVAIAAVLRRN